MRHISPILLSLFLTGCASPLAAATAGINDGRALLEVARVTIDGVCVPRYQAATTPADIEAADVACLPASKAYGIARAAWIAAVAVVLAVRAGSDPAALQAAWSKLAEAAAALAKAVP